LAEKAAVKYLTSITLAAVNHTSLTLLVDTNSSIITVTQSHPVQCTSLYIMEQHDRWHTSYWWVVFYIWYSRGATHPVSSPLYQLNIWHSVPTAYVTQHSSSDY